jgi:hypothetical protein
MAQKDIFISHATKDKSLADAFVDLLETGIGISSDSIFCTSLEGMKIPPGKNFVDSIKDQMQDPKAVILLLTPNYYRSVFCLCELGATWAMCHEFIPILVPPLEYEDIKDVLIGVQLAKIDNDSDLSEMQDRLKTTLGIPGKKTARWEVKRNAFVKDLDEIFKQIPEPKEVSFSEYKKMQSKYEDSIEAMEEYENENSSLRNIIEELKKCKDSEEANEVLLKDLPEAKVFEQLTANVKASLKPFPSIVITALYRFFTDESLLVLRGLEARYDIEEADEAKDNGYLTKDDPEESVYYINESDPSISKALSSLNELGTFIDEKASEEFLEALLEEADCEILLSNRKFWGHYLG